MLEMTERLHRLVAAYWPVITGLILFAAAWGTSTAQLTQVQASNALIINKQDKMADQIAAFQSSLAAVQATENVNSFNMTDFRERLRALEARR